MAVPTTTSFDVTKGPLAGGTTVHAIGTGYTGTTGVTVGGTAATGVVVVDDTHLTFVTPAKTAGAQAVVVTNGTGASTVNLSFTFEAAPTVTALDVATGNTNGGTDITLTGTGFSDVTAVKFGATNAQSFAIVNATTITATSPAGAAGATHVTVVAPGGTSATGSGNAYTYAVVATATYDQVAGNDEGLTYYMDLPLTPASLASGALATRLDPVQYPEVGVTAAAKQGTAGSPNTAPEPASGV